MIILYHFGSSKVLIEFLFVNSLLNRCPSLLSKLQNNIHFQPLKGLTRKNIASKANLAGVESIFLKDRFIESVTSLLPLTLKTIGHDLGRSFVIQKTL